MKLTLDLLNSEAKNFCNEQNNVLHPELLGVNDGKTIGTYVEHRFQNYLKRKYDFTIGSSASGIDFPDDNINTDIKVTSVKHPQSSSPFRNVNQKIYGLGYNLVIFVYDKYDVDDNCYLKFKHCIFIKSSRTGDYTVTKRLREMINDGAIQEDIFGFLIDRNFPGDDITLYNLAGEILSNPPKQGYLTISNALQWRLQYARLIDLNNNVNGVYNYDFKS